MSANRFLAGRHAVVTGGGKGIGEAIARALAREGANLTLLGRDRGAVETLATELQAAHGTAATPLSADVTVAAEIERAFTEAVRRLGAVSILVNNAGQAESSPFTETSRDLWDRMLAVNATAAFECTKRVVPAMLEAGWGRIVNIASTAGLRGVARVAAYAASKHALVGLTRSLALELARNGITVNAVCPGYTDTAIARRAIESIATGTDRTRDEAARRIARPSAFGRLLDPDEVAAAVLWLAGPDAAAVTGQTLVIGGDVV
ncbi:MAG: SDR family NAD(P)-dependent oxidoreductase [Longimicrobiales bacterium]